MNNTLEQGLTIKHNNTYRPARFKRLVNFIFKKQARLKLEQINALLSDNDNSIKVIDDKLSQLR